MLNETDGLKSISIGHQLNKDKNRSPLMKKSDWTKSLIFWFWVDYVDDYDKYYSMLLPIELSILLIKQRQPLELMW